jgi:hypothetical protein
VRYRPGPEAGILLSTFDFANANKVFCFNLVTLQSENKMDASPLSSYLSLTSYLFQHAHRSSRAALYSYLSLFILQILVEDPLLVKRLCSADSKITVRLCRQRQPYLPLVRGDRVPATVFLDLMIDAINHNLRRRLDVEIYMLVTTLLCPPCLTDRLSACVLVSSCELCRTSAALKSALHITGLKSGEHCCLLYVS